MKKYILIALVSLISTLAVEKAMADTGYDPQHSGGYYDSVPYDYSEMGE